MSRGEGIVKHSLGVRCWEAKEPPDWVPECYLYGRRSLRAFNGPLLEWARGGFSLLQPGDALKLAMA
jgi:hypothetical protein